MITASTWPVIERGDRVRALGEAPDLGRVGLVVGVGLTGGAVLGAHDQAAQVVDRGDVGALGDEQRLLRLVVRIGEVDHLLARRRDRRCRGGGVELAVRRVAEDRAERRCRCTRPRARAPRRSRSSPRCRSREMFGGWPISNGGYGVSVPTESTPDPRASRRLPLVPLSPLVESSSSLPQPATTPSAERDAERQQDPKPSSSHHLLPLSLVAGRPWGTYRLRRSIAEWP